ncbi:LysR family transcriptional regulator [Clostridium sp. AF32-12BH]|uniref:LysR family transcriptional regulator n=1 Tax=Clostridium sp. AF32-12BH TaxID=2292006 RepID=UPI000E54B327|nr:LysR family transcriptional regulator [Clostridium sp. AF32-12BH]RHP42160.1 LysR family transcriptional regulator [Clostridium sp. AF32-12BH]
MFQGMRYVYEVYKEMSFSKAARNLFISQPSLSAAVKKEEAQIGFPIFDRSSNPIQLTDLGKEYIRSIEIILDVENGFQNYINDMREIKSGSISIGGTNLFISYVLPPFISRFTERYPQVHLNLVEATTAELTEKLFSGSLDLLIDNQNMDPAVYSKRFFCEEHLLLTVPSRLPVNETMKNYSLTASDILEDRHFNSRIPPVSLEHFQNENFLLLKGGNDTRTRADRMFHNAHVLPKIRLELDQQITAYNLSRHGMGISFSSDTLIRHVPDAENLVYYKLNHQDASREVNFYYKRSRYMPKVVSTFLDMI